MKISLAPTNKLKDIFLAAASNNQDWWANLPPLAHAQALVDLANEASHDGKSNDFIGAY